MSFFELARRSLCYYWRTNLGVLLAAAVATAVLTGALAVGDSVRYSLAKTVEARLGSVELAVVGQDRFFRDELAADLGAQFDTNAAAVILSRAAASNGDGTRRANMVQILGVDSDFYALGPGGDMFEGNSDESVVLNEPLARKLGVSVGDEVLLRIAKPALVPRDIPLTPDSDLSVAFRLKVKAVADESQFGRFGLQANQISPLNAFVPKKWLGEKLDRQGQANVLLLGQANGLTVEKANAAIGEHWKLADAELELNLLKDSETVEMLSDRVFIDKNLSQKAIQADKRSIGILTYFVNGLRLGDKSTPYSMVSAVSASKVSAGPIPADMRDDEILITRWMADDLGANVGDRIELSYFVIGPMRKLIEQKSSFSVCGILEMQGWAVDSDLMPRFPGISDVNNCRDWEPGIPIDLDKIRDKDEDYWDTYRGAPKAFVTLAAGQRMWENRYGNLTAVRYPQAADSRSQIAGSLLENIDPASVGLFFRAVQRQGVRAGNQATDFGQLFLGFSFFLVISAVILTALVFVFGVEKRSGQIGMLMAVGIRPRQIKRLLLLEGTVVAFFAAVLGTLAGLLYTVAMIGGLATLWRTAVSGSTISFHAEPTTLLIGAAVGIFVSLGAIWVTLRNVLRKSPRELLAGELKWQFFGAGKVSTGRLATVTAVISIIAAAGLFVFAAGGQGKAMAGVFFGAGMLLLAAGIAVCRVLLTIISAGLKKPVHSIGGLGFRNASRRAGRSMAVIGLLACGVFLVVAVGANRHDPTAYAERRDSGTGGFALFGESAIAVLHDLNSEQGQRSIGIDPNALKDADIVQLRLRDGDDASCFNLNRAQKPRLLGVAPDQFSSRGAFTFTKTIGGGGGGSPWQLLSGDYGQDVVPAIGDAATITWALGKSVGDEIQYQDDKGRLFKVLLVGMLDNSILQGNLIIAEDRFVEHFSSVQGYRVFLVDSAEDKSETVAAALTRGLRDYGLDIGSASQRLADFSGVENTYLSIFQMLGGLGIILGSVGLGLVVVRNVLDRRGELAMLRAIGFDKKAVKKMVLYEHVGLMLAGLVIGIVAALVSVSGAISSPGAGVPYLSLSLTVGAIVLSGLVWIRIAAGVSLSGEMIDALRNE